MTPISDIRKRAEAATPGPWYVDGPEFGGMWVTSYSGESGIAGGVPVHPSAKDQPYAVIAGLGEADADFIAHARTDIPALLEALDSLTAERDALREALTDAGWMIVGIGIPPGARAVWEPDRTNLLIRIGKLLPTGTFLSTHAHAARALLREGANE